MPDDRPQRPTVVRKANGRHKLVRPRGKRGGAKNRSATFAKKIAQYHTLEKQLAQTSDARERKRLKAQQEALGGLAVYQDHSLVGGDKLRGGESAKWCVQVLRELVEPHAHLKVLDVGAIAGTSYAKWSSWITPTYIDLNPRADHVHQCDFFAWPTGETYDLVGLSLVINFVGDLRLRGACMLTQAPCFFMRTSTLYRAVMCTSCSLWPAWPIAAT